MTREQQMQDMMTAAFWRDIEEGNQPDHADAIEIAKTYERAYQQGWKDADSHPHWIPVEEELPPHRNQTNHKFENDFSVNCFVSDEEFVDVGYYDYRLRKWNCEFLTNVICWYIPQPPRKE